MEKLSNNFVFKFCTDSAITIVSEKLDDNECVCLHAKVYFTHGQHTYFIVEEELYDVLTTFFNALKAALKKKLLFHLAHADIGSLYNDYLCDVWLDRHSSVIVDNFDQYIVWSCCHQTSNLTVWMFNVFDGSIVFELTPVFDFSHYEQSIKGLEQDYKSWATTEYQSFFKVIVLYDVATAWAKQLQLLLDMIEKSRSERVYMYQ